MKKKKETTIHVWMAHEGRSTTCNEMMKSAIVVVFVALAGKKEIEDGKCTNTLKGKTASYSKQF